MSFQGDHGPTALRRKLTLLVSLFVGIVVFVLVLSGLRSTVLASVRAYIQGEGYWSKAQKEAVISLTTFAESGSPEAFDSYLSATRIPLGDKAARLELEKPTPDMNVVFRGFLQGQNDPNDIPGMARLFRWFHNVGFVKTAITDWTEGDREFAGLMALSEQLHAEMLSGRPDPQTRKRLLQEIEAADSSLTIVENHFSVSLRSGERRIRNLLNVINVVIAAFLLVLGIQTSRYLLKNVERSEGRYRQLYELASDAILLVDFVSTKIVRVNDRAAEMLGRAKNELEGQPESALFPPGEELNYGEIARRRLLGGEAQSAQLKLLHADGRILEVDANLRLVDLPGSDRPVIMAMCRDTGELKRANRGLRALSLCIEEMVRTDNERELLERICEIIVTVGGYRMAWVGFPENDEQRTVRVAAQYGDAAGYLKTIKFSWADVPHTSRAGIAIRTKQITSLRSVASEAAQSPWTPLALANNIRSVIAIPLTSGEEVLGALSIYSDKEGAFDETEVNLLRELSANLAYGIATLRLREERERAAEEVKVLEEQLRQAQKMESLGQLAGGVAHDFNNLLTVIRGYAELALPSNPDEEDLRRKINEIMKSSDRAQSLVSKLLSFSRKQVLKPAVMDLNQVVTEISEVLPRLIGENIRIEVLPGARLRRIKADPNLMQQVLINLAVNARDAMPNGGTLRLSTENAMLPPANKEEKAKEAVLLSVSDTGKGISPELRTRVFEPFFTTKERGKGTGLGLAMVYGTVSQSGGTIDLDSEVGKGTTFRMLFPATTEELPTAPRKRRARAGTDAGGTILLVEDEESLRELVGDFLSRSGFSVLAAANGLEALEMAKNFNGNLRMVVSDVVMPGMSGRELAERLRVEHPAIPVLFMSGYADDERLRRGVSERQDHYIEKPFELQALARKVQEVIAAASQ